MAGGFYSHVAVLVVVISTGTVISTNCRTKQGSCCTKCNPGFMLSRGNPCGKCNPCPKNSFMDQPNSKPNCNICTKCVGIFQLKEECSPTRNAVCECIKGKRCVGENCNMCANNICKEGQQLVREECMDCPQGTFNPGEDGICKPWKRCSAAGSYILHNGTSTSDVVCGQFAETNPSAASATTSPKVVDLIRESNHPKESGSEMVSIFIIIGAAVLSMALLGIAIIFLWPKCIKQMKNEIKKFPVPIEKTTKEEDACSCHFPEEEQGDEDMTQQPLNHTDSVLP
ncbi:tumor necrosis factor receptor superfamily member 9 isoform 1-T2 [Discoglossus pictus]